MYPAVVDVFALKEYGLDPMMMFDELKFEPHPEAVFKAHDVTGQSVFGLWVKITS